MHGNKRNYHENPKVRKHEKDKHEFEGLSRKIIGAAIEVHRELGPGFLESIYEGALKVELTKRRLYHESQKEIKIEYLAVAVGFHRLDLIVENEIIIELKAAKKFADTHFAQLRSYLKATGLKVGAVAQFCKTHFRYKKSSFLIFVLSCL